MEKQKHIAIIDHVGRTIIGEFVGETDTTLSIYNPVILHCQPQPNGQLEVQTFPVLFFEFIDKDNRDKNTWTYQKGNIVTNDVVLTELIIAQYSKINQPQVEVPAQSNPKIISINDL